MNDTTTFGGLINSFLTVIRDQHMKLPCLVVPFLSSGITRQLEGDNVSQTLCLVDSRSGHPRQQGSAMS